MEKSETDLLTVTEAAIILKVSPATVRNLIHEGRLDAIDYNNHAFKVTGHHRNALWRLPTEQFRRPAND